MSLANRSGDRALRPRLRWTCVAVPARPRCAAWAIAVSSKGVGELRFWLTGAGVVDGGELHEAGVKIARAASARNPRIGSVWRFTTPERCFPDPQRECRLEPALAIHLEPPPAVPSVARERCRTSAPTPWARPKP